MSSGACRGMNKSPVRCNKVNSPNVQFDDVAVGRSQRSKCRFLHSQLIVEKQNWRIRVFAGTICQSIQSSVSCSNMLNRVSDASQPCSRNQRLMAYSIFHIAFCHLIFSVIASLTSAQQCLCSCGFVPLNNGTDVSHAMLEQPQQQHLATASSVKRDSLHLFQAVANALLAKLGFILQNPAQLLAINVRKEHTPTEPHQLLALPAALAILRFLAAINVASQRGHGRC